MHWLVPHCCASLFGPTTPPIANITGHLRQNSCATVWALRLAKVEDKYIGYIIIFLTIDALCQTFYSSFLYKTKMTENNILKGTKSIKSSKQSHNERQVLPKQCGRLSSYSSLNMAVMKYVQMHRDCMKAMYFTTRKCIEYPA